MSTIYQRKDAGIIFQNPNQAEARPMASPQYRQRALRSIISQNQDLGKRTVSLSELALQMRDQSLRDDIDPAVEPLSLASINAAVNDLIHARELLVDDRTVYFSEPPAQPDK